VTTACRALVGTVVGPDVLAAGDNRGAGQPVNVAQRATGPRESASPDVSAAAEIRCGADNHTQA